MKIPRFVGLAVFVFAGTAAAQPSTLYGSKAFENFGLAVAAGGDLDSDGFLDVLVGFPGDVLGSATVAIPCGVRGYSGQSGAMILKVDHPDPSDWFGHAICSIGDVDQDGHDDVAVGAPNDSIGFAFLCGRVHVLSGKTGKALFTADGKVTAEQLGWSLAPLGDVDQDGITDFAAGAPGAAGTVANAGAVRVVRGATGATFTTLLGTSAGGRFGAAVGPAGDVDHDGVPDVVVGAPFATIAGAATGEVSVHTAAGSPLLKVPGAAAGDRFGAAVTGIGDVNGDSVQDLAIGAPGDDSAGNDAGAVRLADGKDGSQVRVSLGIQAGALHGSAVAAAGDVNGDGVNDLLAGAPGAGWAGVVSGSNGFPVHVFSGPADFGASVADLGDLDQDGQRDVAVGAPSDLNPFGLATGAVRVLAETPIASKIALDEDDDVFLQFSPGGPLPAAIVRTVENAGVGPLNWSVSIVGPAGMVSATPDLGTTAAGGAGSPVTLSFDPVALPEGKHEALVVFQNDDVPADRVEVEVELQVGEPATEPKLCVTGPATLLVDHSAGAPPPADVLYHLTNCGEVSSPVEWSVEVLGAVASKVSVTPSAGVIAGGATTPVTIAAAVDPTGLQNGIHQGALRFLHGDAVVLTVPLTITVELPGFTLGDVLVGHAGLVVDAGAFTAPEQTKVKVEAVPLSPSLRLRVTLRDSANVPVAAWKSKAGKPLKKKVELPASGTFLLTVEAIGERGDYRVATRRKLPKIAVPRVAKKVTAAPGGDAVELEVGAFEGALLSANVLATGGGPVSALSLSLVRPNGQSFDGAAFTTESEEALHLVHVPLGEVGVHRLRVEGLLPKQSLKVQIVPHQPPEGASEVPLDG